MEYLLFAFCWLSGCITLGTCFRIREREHSKRVLGSRETNPNYVQLELAKIGHANAMLSDGGK